MKVGPSVKMKRMHCLNCHELLDGATGVDTGVDSDTKCPKPGCITICLYCGHLMVFANDLTLREPTGEEMHDIAGNETVLAIQRARGKVFKQ